MTPDHEHMMRRALLLARRGIGKTSPNPAVGCVIVRNGAVVGEGWHRKAGTPHAEVHALREAGELARGADAYVTLEPCSHFGRTPPCADALVAAGVARVVVGMVDPNPKVCGRGLARLEQSGVQVITGVLEKECRQINEPFVKHVSTGLPYLILKSALTLDGKTATASGESRWITNEKSRQYVHGLRAAVDAVMVGVGTLLADDPELTVRHVRGRSPLRIIVDSSLRIPDAARVLGADLAAGTLIATVSDDQERIAYLETQGAQVVRCASDSGRVDLRDLMVHLGQRGIQSILLEGGSGLAGAALRLGLIDKFILFYAPKFLGGADGLGLFGGTSAARMEQAFCLETARVRRFGGDVMIEAYPEGTCSQG